MAVSVLLLSLALAGAVQQPAEAAAPAQGERAPLPADVVAAWDGGSIGVEVFERWLGGMDVFPEFREEAMRHLIQLHFIRGAARMNGIEVPEAEAEARVVAAERAAEAGGQDLEQVLAERLMTRADLVELMRVSLMHEELARRSFGLAEDAPVSPQQLNAWTAQYLPDGTMTALLEESKKAPEGMALDNGDLHIGVRELGLTLRRTVPAARLRDYVEQLALQEALPRWARKQGLSLTPELLDKEIAWRRAFVARSPESFGATYEMILETRGLKLEDVRASDELRTAAHLWLLAEQRYPDSWFAALAPQELAALRAEHGASRRVGYLLLRAVEEPGELDLSFEDAAAELRRLAADVDGWEAFQELAARYSDDEMSRRRRGELGWLHRDEPRVEPALCEAAFATPVGSLSAPVRVAGGMALVFPVEEQGGPEGAAFRDAVRRGMHQALRAEFLESIDLRTVYDDAR